MSSAPYGIVKTLSPKAGSPLAPPGGAGTRDGILSSNDVICAVVKHRRTPSKAAPPNERSSLWGAGTGDGSYTAARLSGGQAPPGTSSNVASPGGRHGRAAVKRCTGDERCAVERGFWYCGLWRGGVALGAVMWGRAAVKRCAGDERCAVERGSWHCGPWRGGVALGAVGAE